MMRYWWRISISGDGKSISLDVCFLLGSLYFGSLVLTATHGVMLVLNLYSYDYQRRRKVKP